MAVSAFYSRVLYRDGVGYYDDPKAPRSSFYENDYVALHPRLHSEDADDKYSAVLSILHASEIWRIESVLDIGCGSGEVLRRLLDEIGRRTGRVIHGIGVDISGRILANGTPDPRITRLRADSRDLPLRGASSSLALCMDLLEHLEDPAAALAEAGRASRLVVVKIPLERSLYTLLRGGSPRLNLLRQKFGHLHHYDHKRLSRMLKQAGCAEIRRRHLRIPRRSPMIAGLQSALLSAGLGTLFAWTMGGFALLLVQSSEHRPEPPAHCSTADGSSDPQDFGIVASRRHVDRDDFAHLPAE